MCRFGQMCCPNCWNCHLIWGSVLDVYITSSSLLYRRVKLNMRTKFNMRPMNVMLRFCHLETSGQIIFTFCSHCISYYPEAAESLESFLVIEYSLKYLHKLLKQRWWKREGWMQPEKFNRRKRLPFFGRPSELLWLAHVRRHREPFSEWCWFSRNRIWCLFHSLPWFICNKKRWRGQFQLCHRNSSIILNKSFNHFTALSL